MNDLAQRMTEHRRLVILRLLTDVPAEDALRRRLVDLLAEAPGMMANISLLHEVIVGAGLPVSRETIAAALGWLAERGLVAYDQSGPVGVARLTDRGADLAAGLVEVGGVQSPATVGWLRDGMESVGVLADVDQVLEACGWLFAHGLVQFDSERSLVVPVLPDAAEVATGRRVVDGVRTPGRKAIMAAAANAAKDRL